MPSTRQYIDALMSLLGCNHNIAQHCSIHQASTSTLGDILTVEDLERLLQGFNLFLAPGNTVLVADTRIYAGWLQLVKIGKCGIKLLLSALQVLILCGQGLGLVLFLGSLVLNVS